MFDGRIPPENNSTMNRNVLWGRGGWDPPPAERYVRSSGPQRGSTNGSVSFPRVPKLWASKHENETKKMADW